MHEQLSLLTKACMSCGRVLSLDDFHRDRGKRDGRSVHCRACASAKAKARYRADPEPAKRRARQWQITNRERVNELHRKRRAKDPAKFTAGARRWKYENREAWRAQKRRNAARGRVGRGDLEVAYLDVLLSDPCSYCGAPADTVDHIVARAAGGENTWPNLTAACRSCNSHKNVTPLLLFLLRKD